MQTPLKECETNQKSNKVLSASGEERITAFVHSTCLLEELYKFALTNQKHYTDVVVTHHQYKIFAVLPQASFPGETSGGVGK